MELLVRRRYHKGRMRLTVEAEGKVYVIVGVALGDDMPACYLVRRLTGTTKEEYYGSLVGAAIEFYGEHRKQFDALDYSGTVEECADMIALRIHDIRSWIANCDALDAYASGEVTITIPDKGGSENV